MSEERKRWEDGGMAKFMKLWPVVLALAVLAATYGRYDQKLNDTARLASATAEKVAGIREDLAVQKSMLVEVRDAIKDIARKRRDE